MSTEDNKKKPKAQVASPEPAPSAQARKRLDSIARARKLLGDARLLAFLRCLRKESDILACEFINEDLDAGTGLAALDEDGGEWGFSLKAKHIAKNHYHIKFGAAADGTAGDGGEWDVTFTGDEIKGANRTAMWMS